MAAMTNGVMPWEYWRVKFAERGICSLDGFGDMDMRDVGMVIAVWDGEAKAQAEQMK
jgi:hypothetical protein